jgi:hypothetical protein
VIAYLKNGSDIGTTIRTEKDVRKFLFVRRVTGGAVWRGHYLGKVVRWYYSTDGDIITYGPGKKEGHKVGKTDGSRPMMTLTDSIPLDLDFDRYVTEAYEMLKEIGTDTIGNKK